MIIDTQKQELYQYSSISVPTAFLMGCYVLEKWLHLGQAFITALFTLLILPHSIIIPMYTRSNRVDE